MIAIVELFAGVLLLSSCIAYAMWVRVRVWRFRQDLFEIRDRLWDHMYEQGRLEGETHREARDAINALIRFAPALSLVSVSILLASGIHDRTSTWDDSAPNEVRIALHKAVGRTLRLIVFESPLGLSLLLCFRLVRFNRTALARLDIWIDRILRSGQFKDGDVSRTVEA